MTRNETRVEAYDDEARWRRNVAVIRRFASCRFGSRVTGTEIVDDLRAVRASRVALDVGDAGDVGEQETRRT